VFTIFIPCGVTQAMEILAINSGNPIQGMLILSSFVLGTSPIFLILGITTTKLASMWKKAFMWITAIALIAMSIYSLNGIFTVLDYPFSFHKIFKFSRGNFEIPYTFLKGEAKTDDQRITIAITKKGYSPSYIRVKSGIPVLLTVESHNVYSCALSFVLKEFGIETMLNPTDRKIFTFTPEKKGTYTYSCSMGMYSGVLEVID
jgi:heme/copper-type cytochrome/quinol oxidase subunit 2